MIFLCAIFFREREQATESRLKKVLSPSGGRQNQISKGKKLPGVVFSSASPFCLFAKKAFNTTTSARYISSSYLLSCSDVRKKVSPTESSSSCHLDSNRFSQHHQTNFLPSPTLSAGCTNVVSRDLEEKLGRRRKGRGRRWKNLLSSPHHIFPFSAAETTRASVEGKEGGKKGGRENRGRSRRRRKS